SGTREHTSGFTRTAMATISSVAAISRLKVRRAPVRRARSRSTSASTMWRRSSRRCAVMPWAPASRHCSAARTGSGYVVPRALRRVATWSTLTWRRTAAFTVAASFLVRRGGLAQLLVGLGRLQDLPVRAVAAHDVRALGGRVGVLAGDHGHG